MFTPKWNKRFVIKTFVVLTVFVLTISFTRLSDSSNSICENIFKNIRGEVLPDTNIVLINISGNDIAQLGGWPLKRSYYALLINELNKYGVKKIGVEVFFSGRNSIQTMYDNLLISQIKSANNVILSSVPGNIFFKNNTWQTDTIDFPSLKEIDPSIKTGHLGLIEEGIIPLQVGNEKAFAAQVAGSKRADEIKVNITSSWKYFHQYELLEFFSLIKQSSPTLQQLRGKIILIGVSDEKFTKKFSSPFDAFLPGIAFHAFAVSNLLQNNAYNESLIPVSIPLHFLFLLLFVFLFEKKTLKRRNLIAAVFAILLISEFIIFSFLNYELHFA